RPVLQRIECKARAKPSAFLAIDLVFFAWGWIVKRIRVDTIFGDFGDRVDFVDDIRPKLFGVSRLSVTTSDSDYRDVAWLRCSSAPTHSVPPPASAPLNLFNARLQVVSKSSRCRHRRPPL